MLPTSFADGLRVSCGNNPKPAREILELMLKVVPARLGRPEAAVLAGDEGRRVEEGHSLYGAFATIGVKALAEACKGLMAPAGGADSAAIEKGCRIIRTRWEGLEKEANHYLATLQP
jgi:hypothetical protein